MKIFVRLTTGDIVPFMVETSTTINELKQRILNLNKQDGGVESLRGVNEEESSPAITSKKRKLDEIVASPHQALVFEGRQLQEDFSIEDCALPQEATLSLVAKTPRSKCAFVDCLRRPVIIVGNCKFCSQNFCMQHRLPETHICPNMTDCRQQSFDRNKAKLIKEKCVAAKV